MRYAHRTARVIADVRGQVNQHRAPSVVIEVLLRAIFSGLIWAMAAAFIAALATGLSGQSYAPLVVFCAVYAGFMLGYLYVRLVRKITVLDYLKEKPRLRPAVLIVMAAAERVSAFMDRCFQIAGALASGAIGIGVALAAIVLVGALLFWIGGAIFSSALWWALVIIVLLILILLK